MRIHQKVGTADNTDVLAGTALDSLEAGGQLDIYAVASGADTVMSITGPDSEPIATAINVASQARAPSIQDDTPFSLATRTGGHYTLSIDITAASTWQVICVYRKRGVDF